MRINGLHDGLDPEQSLDDRSETWMADLIACCADDGGDDGGGGGGSRDDSTDDDDKGDDDKGKDDKGKDKDDDASDDDDLDDPEDLDRVDKKKLEKILEDRRRKGKSEAALKKEKAAMEKELADLRKFKDAKERESMSTQEKLESDLKKEREEKEKLKNRIDHLDRVQAVSKALPEYRPILAEQLKLAEEADKDLDREQWLADQEKTRPALFGSPAPAAAGGHQRQGSETNAEKIEKLEKKRDEGQKYGTLSSGEIAVIDSQIQRLKLGIEWEQ